MQEQIRVVVGRIGKPHGIRGEVTVDVRTDEPQLRFADDRTLLAQPPAGAATTVDRLTVESSRWHQGVLLVRFAEVADRNDAELLRNTVLSIDLDTTETPDDPEEFYDHQLVGLTAYDQDGTRLGEVTAVTHGAAQDLLTIRTDDGRTPLVPFVSALVPVVDLEAGTLTVADRPGLVAPHPDDTTDETADTTAGDPAGD